MCGIAGYLSLSGAPADRKILAQMIDALGYRGPDERGIYLNGSVGLAHTRLSIIDISGGRQPMHSQDGSLCITFNGEIFNYLELQEDLRSRGHRFTTRSDTEIILHLYQEYGDECLQRLNGEWSFAIWDAPRRKLFAARDRLGIRPFFYTSTKETFAFASEIKAICRCPTVERELDLVALDQIFTLWVVLPPRTILKHVLQLPPAHYLSVVGGRVKVDQYWRLDYNPEPDALTRQEEYAEALCELLLNASRMRLRSDVPVGVYLSGGLDSTVVAALARQVSTAPLKTFSVAFEESNLDESWYQHQVTNFLRTEHCEARYSCTDICRVFPQVVWHMETPVLRTAPAPLYLLSKLVRDSGYKVVLTGEGSDEILGGYDLFKETKIRQFWAAQPNSKYRARLLRRLYPYLPKLQSQPDAYLRSFFHVDAHGPADPFFSHQPRWKLTAMLKAFFSQDIRSALRNTDTYQQIRETLPSAYQGWDAFTRAQYLETAYLLPGYILSSQGDRVAMAHSVEARHPFLDHNVVEFAARLPSHLKMKVLSEKYLLKLACSNLVPPAVLQRTKQPFRAPDARALLSASDSNSDYTHELLAPVHIRDNGIFDPAAVTRLLAKCSSGTGLSVRDDMAVVGIVSTQLFFDQFLSACPAYNGRSQPLPCALECFDAAS